MYDQERTQRLVLLEDAKNALVGAPTRRLCTSGADTVSAAIIDCEESSHLSEWQISLTAYDNLKLLLLPVASFQEHTVCSRRNRTLCTMLVDKEKLQITGCASTNTLVLSLSVSE